MSKSTLPLIIFSHGNSFPASTYGVLFQSLKARGFQIQAIEKFGHDPRYPVTSNWPNLVQQLADFASQEVEKSGQPAFLVGHSLGGFLSLMCAARHPQLGGQKVGGVLMLDSPVLGGWRAKALSVAKRAKLVGSISPGAISRKRRHQWLGRDEVLAHFRSKKAFACWDEQVLRDYIDHGTHDEGGTAQGQRLLSFDRDVETAIYNTLPDNLEQLLRSHPLQCSSTFIGGRQSAEMKQVGMAMTQKVTQGRIMMLDGSHLFPMEKPLATAAAIEAALLNFMG
ncbi:alpha/beta hydrolase [Polaromonas sp. CG_23.6]|uniref:alpha/beta hydrolase n=1 Tax=unclassified Polaromonas TaxID=2638319 RepID=UPI0018C95B60|nr:alpha/beta hydrolase [Polaromonas sp. CG_23.6]MBG6072514.1 pimeloyl-ACP methyl ester carboxylesterase [Polaromonas sp. CG_9.7]MBG6114518.1 pimeloyl-ACP methyl ester carboxylesterase [Polaromonas sp. CG_9.2]MDH6185522.1 pimeloyl-ACP methyl ester carboxylesterase [Polaromonas sp. CG_23.6]